MPKPICVPCQRFFVMQRIGFNFVEAAPEDAEAPSGTAEPERWKPYKLWTGDYWQCPGCGANIITRDAIGPIARHSDPNFPDLVEKLGAKFQVNDR